MLKTPVLFLVFNRPETTKKVFEAIRAAQPQQLFIAADGPRQQKPEEKEKVEEVINIVSQVDWKRDLHTLFRSDNLGCGQAVSSAINWFFSYVEEGIILEDDTLPNQSFFSFCENLLKKYKDDERIGQINGSNFQFGKKRGKDSYYFSIYPMIWGWATWRRAWQKYEYEMKSYSTVSEHTKFWSRLNSQDEKNYWEKIYRTMHSGFISKVNVIDTWDYQWIYTCWRNNWLAITPNTNLVTNLGFGEGATHTKAESLVANLPQYEMHEIRDPRNIIPNKSADIRVYKIYFNPPPKLINRIRNIVYKTMPLSFISILRGIRRKYFVNLK